MATYSPIHIIQFLFLLTHTLLIPTQSYTNITRGTTFTTSGPLTAWASTTGDFAFGFYPTDSTNSTYLLGVWFDRTYPKSLVWFVNGQVPIFVEPGGTFQVTADGGFYLKDKSGNVLWTPRVYSAAYAAILDSGNLVFVGSDSTVLWESFYPGLYMLLPTQTLANNDMLWSRLMDSDYSKGRFQLINQNDGDLVLSIVNTPTGETYAFYWDAGTSGSNNQLVFSEDGHLFLDFKNGTIFNLTKTTNFPTNKFYHRMTLDSDGAFRQYIHPKPGFENVSWPKQWKAVASFPSDVCQLLTWSAGSGSCGFNSYCTLDSLSLLSTCHCPPQYTLLDPTKVYKGCIPNFTLQNCLTDESAFYDFADLNDTEWHWGEYEIYSPIDEEQCRQYCLNDCFCQAIFLGNDSSCSKKRLPLANGRMNPYVGGKMLIKIPKGNQLINTDNSTLKLVEKESHRLLVLASVLLGASGLFNLTFIIGGLIIIFGFCTREKGGFEAGVRSTIPSMKLRAFSYKEIEEATKSFKEELGRGSFGRVYMGYLALDGKICVAVKRFEKLLDEYEREFLNEVRSIGHTHHKNLVKLFGFCSEGEHRMLVYEYMSNGSLTEFLFGSNKPIWNIRANIALGIAKGLVYLHDECSTQIIHCDIKPQNILLDKKLVPKISDFGVAKLLMEDQTRTQTGVKGTRGYIAPEWFKNKAITTKVDVFSYGVVLLEIIFCRRNVDQEINEEEKVILTYWAYDCFRNNRMELLKDIEEDLEMDMSQVERFLMVAFWCIQEDPELRPCMQKVLNMLHGADEVHVPPDPSPSITSIS